MAHFLKFKLCLDYKSISPSQENTSWVNPPPNAAKTI